MGRGQLKAAQRPGQRKRGQQHKGTISHWCAEQVVWRDQGSPQQLYFCLVHEQKFQVKLSISFLGLGMEASAARPAALEPQTRLRRRNLSGELMLVWNSWAQSLGNWEPLCATTPDKEVWPNKSLSGEGAHRSAQKPQGVPPP